MWVKLSPEQKIYNANQRMVEAQKNFVEAISIFGGGGKIILPIYMYFPRVSKWAIKKAINFNIYRNLHFHMNNKMKQDFKNIVKSQINNLPKKPGQYWVTYTLYYAEPACDLRNVTPVVGKFFEDALQELWITQEDNVKFLIEWHDVVWGQDRTYPRVEATII